MTPGISVLMPVYNGAPYVARALDSILAQTYRDFELIVIDDGSDDASASIIEERAVSDRRIVVLRQRNQGVIASLNRGLSMARAPYVARMDADDVAHPRRLERQIELMERRPEVGVVGTYLRVIDAVGVPGALIQFPTGAAEVAERILFGSPIAHPAAMMRRDLIRALGGYRPFYRHSEDYDLWLRVHEVATIDNVPEVLLDYRQHGQNVSRRHAETQLLGTFLAQGAYLLRRRGEPDPTALLPEISEAALASLPLTEHERAELYARLLAAAMERLEDPLSSGVVARIGLALREFDLSPQARAATADFHLRAVRAALKSGRGGMALRHLLEALHVSPLSTVRQGCAVGTRGARRALHALARPATRRRA